MELVFLKFQKKRVFSIDFLLAGVSAWFVIFTREPYSIAILFLFAGFLWNRKIHKIHLFSLGLFIFLSLLTLFSYNIQELFYNMAFVNQTNLTGENAETGIFGLNIYKSFFYPFVIF